MDDEILKKLEEKAAALQEAKKVEDDEDLENQDAEVELGDEDDSEEDEGCKDEDEMKESKKTKNESFIDLFDGEDLSEEFKTKAAAIFEAAVALEINKRTEELTEQFAAREQELTQRSLQESAELKESLEEKIDGYLDYVVEQWMENNKLALDRGIRAELFESFMSGMHKLFVEHQINVPEEQLDIVDELREETENLQKQQDALLAENVNLKQTLKQIDRLNIIDEISEGLTDIEAERFQSLAEDLVYENADSFRTKLEVIRENFFGQDEKTNSVKQAIVESIVSDAPMLTEEIDSGNQIDGTMSRYVQVLSRSL